MNATTFVAKRKLRVCGCEKQHGFSIFVEGFITGDAPAALAWKTIP